MRAGDDMPLRAGSSVRRSARPYPAHVPQTSSALRLGLIAVVVIGGYALSRLTQRPAPPPPGSMNALPQAAYVRERHWSEPVLAAVRGAAGIPDAPDPAAANSEPPLEGLVVLCAEISPVPGSHAREDGQSSAAVIVNRTSDLDWSLLASSARPVGLLVRVRAFPGKEAEVSPQREPFPTLRRVLDETFAATTTAGLRPAGVQIQFDCPLTQLRGYAACLETLRAAYPERAFHPVARPSWLRAPDFAPLARGAGEYVLDLQGLDRSGAGADAPPDAAAARRAAPETLCDPAAAADAVEAASRLGIPFRVSLPATGYRLILDADGRLVATASEGRNAAAPASADRVRVPPGGSERPLRANAEEMAGLVAEWSWRRPVGLSGILWDRLPVAATAGERLDWAAATFRAVRAGKVPKSHLEWKFPDPTADSDGRDLALHNTGDAEAPLPPILTIRCPEPPVSVEAAGPYEVVPRTPKEHLSPREVRFRLQKTPAPGNSGAASATTAGDGQSSAASAATPFPRTLAPGESLRFGTVRLPSGAGEADIPEDEIDLDLEMKRSPSPSRAAGR